MKATKQAKKTLQEALDESERLYRETGHYYGLEKLELATENPVKIELFYSRFLAALIAGREQARMVSASATVRDIGELAVAVYTPEGDCIAQSTGIIIHVDIMGYVIRWMIRHNYEEDMGINEGDIFTSNDNMIAGLHPADIYDIIPLFWEGELIGWVGTVIMEAELGSITPGGVSSLSTERFVEGIRWTAEKTGANDHWFKSAEQRIQYNCRCPGMLLLDRKAALAADLKVREGIKELIEEMGIDYYKKASRELIEWERINQAERVKKRTVPGRLRTVGVFESYYKTMPVPPHHAMDYITFVPFDYVIQSDGTYFWDFDGAGAWGWHPNNTSPSALNGAACLFLTQTIAYTGHANSGTLLNVKVNCPYDTFVNPSSPWVASGGFISGANVLGAIAVGVQSRAFFSRGFVEEVMTGSPSFFGWALAGKNQAGKDFAQLFAGECAATNASGACAIRDGFTGYVIWLPPSDMGNIEIAELGFPLLCTGRRLLPDSCGWGKFRSGYPIVSSYLVYWTNKLVFQMDPHSTNDKIYLDTGLYGGYPGVNQFFRLLVESNGLEMIKQRKPLVHGIGLPEKDELTENVKGRLVVETSGSRFIRDVAKGGDICQAAYGGNAGGLGDPIKRDPALIKKDLDLGLLTPDRCRSIHCVEAKYDEKAEEWVIDQVKTAELREKRKQERLAKGMPVKEWWQKRRNDITDGRMPQILKQTYNNSLEKGERWPKEFREFWRLPADFTFKVEEV